MKNSKNRVGFQPNHNPSFFSVASIGMLIFFMGFGNLISDPPSVWIEKADRERIEEGTKMIQIRVMLSETTDQDVIVRLDYWGDAKRGQDFQAPDVVVVPAGELELLVDIQLRPTYYDKRDMVVSMLSVENGTAMNDPQKYLVNRRLGQQTQDTPEINLRTAQGNVKYGDFIDINNSSGDYQGTYIGDSTATFITSGDYNTLIGFAAGRLLTNGHQNTLIGWKAGEKQRASEGTFIGYEAGRNNTTGFDATFIGKDAGRSNTTGGDNTFIGTESGELNTTGYDNTFVGEESGANNTTGYENTFIGEDAGFSNTTGRNQTFVGNEAGISSDAGFANSALGNEAMSDIAIGHHNTAVGDSSGIDVNRGLWNTFLGASAGPATEHASFNTFVGGRAGWDNNRTNSTTNANRNTYVGYYAGFSNREGQDNVGMGAFSNFNNTNRSRTTFIGADQTVGSNDVIMMGYSAYAHNNNNAQYSITIGNESNMRSTRAIGLGYQVSIPGGSSGSISIGSNSSVTGSNSIAIGDATSVAASNEAYIGNATTASIGGVVNWTATSDERFKKNVKTNVPGLAFVNALRPVTYNMDVAAIFARQGRDLPEHLQEAASTKEKVRYSGFLAQQVAKAAEELDYDFSGIDLPQNEEDGYGLRYAEFVVPLVKAVQELHEQVKDRDQVISSQQAELDQYKALLMNLSARVEALEAQSGSQAKSGLTEGRE